MSTNRSKLPDTIVAHVSITQEDIDTAEERRRDIYSPRSRNCPIALALQRVFELVTVGFSRATGRVGGKEYVLSLPVDAQLLRSCFDSNRRCGPIEFDITGVAV